MALSEAKRRRTRNTQMSFRNNFNYASGIIIYEGALQGIDPADGLIKTMQATFRFVGVAMETYESLATDSTDYPVSLEMNQIEEIQQAGLGGDTAVGRSVLATDDSTIIFGLPTAVNTVGKIVQYKGNDVYDVWVIGPLTNS